MSEHLDDLEEYHTLRCSGFDPKRTSSLLNLDHLTAAMHERLFLLRNYTNSDGIRFYKDSKHLKQLHQRFK